MKPALPLRFPPPDGPVDLLVVAGEHSGDQHAAAMVRELRARHPELKVAALGGPELAASGAQLLHDMTDAAVVGLVEVLKNVRYFKALFYATIEWAAKYRPRVICLVDYPGFNLRTAQTLFERGLSVKGGGDIRVLFYISPQIWAWKSKRRFSMARHLDSLAVIFPFELKSYADTDLPVEFVGHPFLASGHASPVHYDPAGPVLLLPGSRRQAVSRIFPILREGYAAARCGRPAVVLYPDDSIRTLLEKYPLSSDITLRPVVGEPVPASAVLTSSGTMSMHCALSAIPGVIAYRANPLTYLIGRQVVKVRYLGIANLILDEPMYPEYLQGAATPAALAAELKECLESPERLARTREQAGRLRAALAQPASGTAADWLARHLR
jgi:lipid-A-disaccharide synthase